MTLITLAGTLAHRRRGRRRLLFRDAAGDAADRRRPAEQRRRQGGAGAGAGVLRDHSYVRLRPMLTDGATASATALADGKADLAIIRGDLDVPKNAQAVATLRKNVAVLWVPPPAKGKKAGPKITKIAQLAGHRIGVIGRTQANVNLLKVILRQYGVDPAKVDDRAVLDHRGRRGDQEPEGRCVSSRPDRSTARSPPTRSPPRRAMAARRPSSRSIRPTRSRRTIRLYEASEIPAGAFGGSPARPDDEVKTISFSHHIVARRGLSEATVAAFTRQLFAVRQPLMAEFPLAAKIETPDTDKDAVIPVHPGAAAYVDGEEKTFLDRYSDYIWWSLMGAVGDGLGRRLVRQLPEEGRAQHQQLAARAAARHAGDRAPQRFHRRTRQDAGRGRRHPARHADTASSTARSRKAR